MHPSKTSICTLEKVITVFLFEKQASFQFGVFNLLFIANIFMRLPSRAYMQLHEITVLLKLMASSILLAL